MRCKPRIRGRQAGPVTEAERDHASSSISSSSTYSSSTYLTYPHVNLSGLQVTRSSMPRRSPPLLGEDLGAVSPGASLRGVEVKGQSSEDQPFHVPWPARVQGRRPGALANTNACQASLPQALNQVARYSLSMLYSSIYNTYTVV